MALIRGTSYRIDERESGFLPLAGSSVVWRHGALGLSGGRVRALQSGDVFAGFAGKDVDSRMLATGANPEQVPLVRKGEVTLTVTGATSTSVGASVYATADDTFSVGGGGSLIGVIVRVPVSGTAVVAFSALDPALSANNMAAVQALRASGRSRAASRLVGGTNTSSGATNNATHHIKMEAEAPFSAVRFKILGRDTAASLSWKAVVASTASASQASTALMFDPTVDGSTFITTAAASGNPYGWRTATWNNGGATTTDVAAGASNLPGESPWSDWIPCPSLPRVDGGTRPLLMLRIYHDGTANPFTWVSGGFQTTQWLTQSAKDYFRVYQSSHQNTSDNVATLTGKPGSLVGNSPWIVVEFAYNVARARSVIGIGDSIMEGNGTQLPTNIYGIWGMRGCARASTVDRPISWINCGYSSQNSATYLAAGLAAITSTDPSDVLYAAGSPNDTPTSEQFTYDTAMARVQQVIDVCRSGRRGLFLATMVPNENWTLAQDNARKAYNTAIRNLCSSGAATLVDYAVALGDGASPERYIAAYKFDNVHPNDAGCDIGGNLLRDALLATW